MSEMNYVIETLKSETFKIFKGVYNDFKSKAVNEYKFELAPLEYEDFINAVEKGYLKVIVLKENEIPTAFLVYTTSISESIELNLIHCLGIEDKITKQKLLMEKFLEETKYERQSKVVSYPMLGNQSVYTADYAKYGFKFVGQAILRFVMGNASSERVLENIKLSTKDEKYKIVNYSSEYKGEELF